MVVQFNSSKEIILQKKLNRFNELKIKNFQDSFIEDEESEFNELDKWLNTYI